MQELSDMPETLNSAILRAAFLPKALAFFLVVGMAVYQFLIDRGYFHYSVIGGTAGLPSLSVVVWT